MRIFVAIVDVQKRKNVRGTFLFISAHRILFRRCARAKSHVRGWHYRMTGRTPEPNQISDGGEKKLRAIFTSLEGQEGPPLAFRPLVPYQIPRGGRGVPSPSPFPLVLSLRLSARLCLSLELYPLNLQLWGAASMRDTFSRKFARRILKPRQANRINTTRARRRRKTTDVAVCPGLAISLRVLWLAARSFRFPWRSFRKPGSRTTPFPS